MKMIKLFLIILFIGTSFLNAQIVEIDNAEQVAKNYLFERTDRSIEDIQFTYQLVKDEMGTPLYFVFNSNHEKGFVLVSAEKSYYPVIAYSTENRFIVDNQAKHIRSWMRQYEKQIKYLRDNQIEQENDIALLWNKYDVSEDEFVQTHAMKVKAVDPLVGDILWDQDNGWNELCPEDGGGPGGHVYAGCVATAMGIIMKYWNYPIHGTGSNSYTSAYGQLSANFGDATYFWNNMDDTQANLFSAHLLYHLGISVEMSYSPDGSGAFSHNVDDALEDYFLYSTAAQYLSKSAYTQSAWINLLKAQIDSDQPIYYSGSDGETGHAFVCSGYDDDDYFHFNFGWSGSNNGYYTVNEVGGFNINQAAVIEIYPDGSNDYPNEPVSITAELDNSDINNFKVDLEWEAPVTKDVANYLLYRNFDLVTELSSSTTSYSETPEPGNYYYSVSAKYQNDEESLTASDFLRGMFSVTFYAKDASSGSDITQADVTFNGETKPTTFTGAVFSDVVFGGDYFYEVSHEDYETATGYLDVLDNMTVNVDLTSSTSLNELTFTKPSVFPNPSKGTFAIDFKGEYEIEIIDISGKIISNSIISGNTSITLDEKGFYFLKFTNNEHSEIIPVIVQ
jgi:hypothetical protein